MATQRVSTRYVWSRIRPAASPGKLGVDVILNLMIETGGVVFTNPLVESKTDEDFFAKMAPED